MSISMSTILATVTILYLAYRAVLRYLTPKPLPSPGVSLQPTLLFLVGSILAVALGPN